MYAGDIGNPYFRQHWIERAVADSASYRGLFIDDANMFQHVGDGSGNRVTPIDPRTGTFMTLWDWRRYVAEFSEQIRQALPHKELAPNVLWWEPRDDPHVQRQIDASTHIHLERGVNDAGIRGGGGQFGLESYFDYIDWLHARGKAVVIDGEGRNEAELEYGLAAYFMTSTDRDAVGSDVGGSPGDWWTGYDVALGVPQGRRYRWNGLLRRDFQHGFVLVNQPEAATQAVFVGSSATGPTGQPRPTVILGPAEGAVVLNGPQDQTLPARESPADDSRARADGVEAGASGVH